eukprot:g71109.t1
MEHDNLTRSKTTKSRKSGMERLVDLVTQRETDKGSWMVALQEFEAKYKDNSSPEFTGEQKSTVLGYLVPSLTEGVLTWIDQDLGLALNCMKLMCRAQGEGLETLRKDPSLQWLAQLAAQAKQTDVRLRAAQVQLNTLLQDRPHCMTRFYQLNLYQFHFKSFQDAVKNVDAAADQKEDVEVQRYEHVLTLARIIWLSCLEDGLANKYIDEFNLYAHAAMAISQLTGSQQDKDMKRLLTPERVGNARRKCLSEVLKMVFSMSAAKNRTPITAKMAHGQIVQLMGEMRALLRKGVSLQDFPWAQEEAEALAAAEAEWKAMDRQEENKRRQQQRAEEAQKEREQREHEAAERKETDEERVKREEAEAEAWFQEQMRRTEEEERWLAEEAKEKEAQKEKENKELEELGERLANPLGYQNKENKKAKEKLQAKKGKKKSSSKRKSSSYKKKQGKQNGKPQAAPSTAAAAEEEGELSLPEMLKRIDKEGGPPEDDAPDPDLEAFMAIQPWPKPALPAKPDPRMTSLADLQGDVISCLCYLPDSTVTIIAKDTQATVVLCQTLHRVLLEGHGGPKEQMYSNMIPVLTALGRLAKLSGEARAAGKREVFGAHQRRRLHEGPNGMAPFGQKRDHEGKRNPWSLRFLLSEHITSFDSVIKDLVCEFLFQLAEESAEEYMRLVGIGYGVGLMAQKGVPGFANLTKNAINLDDLAKHMKKKEKAKAAS